MAEYKKLDNEDILKAVDVNIRQAVGTFDSKLKFRTYKSNGPLYW